MNILCIYPVKCHGVLHLAKEIVGSTLSARSVVNQNISNKQS